MLVRRQDCFSSSSYPCICIQVGLNTGQEIEQFLLQFSSLYLYLGGVKCWSGDRIVSPLVLSSSFPKYEKWCQVKTISYKVYVILYLVFPPENYCFLVLLCKVYNGIFKEFFNFKIFGKILKHQVWFGFFITFHN